MSTPGARFLFALSAFALFGAVVYGLSTGGDVVGVLSAGYKGGVGDHTGYTLFLSAAVGAGLLGGFMAAFRDVDPGPVSEVAATDELPRVEAPTTVSYWPVIGAFGAALFAVGLVAGATLFVIGGIVLAITIVEWTVRAWSDQATGDPEVNRTIRNRLMFPIEIPAIAVLTIGFLVIGVSRVLLAAPKLGATIIAMVAAGVIFGVAALIAARPKVSPSLLSGLLLAVGLAVVVGGVAGAVVGERDFEEHGEEHGEEHSEDEAEATESGGETESDAGSTEDGAGEGQSEGDIDAGERFGVDEDGSPTTTAADQGGS